MFFEAQENSIIAKLQTDYPGGIDIIPLPEKMADFDIPFSTPKISVAYSESDFLKPKSTDEISQFETQYFDIEIQARNLRGALGIYDLGLKVQTSLLGFSPTHSTKMWAIKFERHGLLKGIWTYVLRMATQTIICEVVPDPTGVPLAAITAQ